MTKKTIKQVIQIQEERSFVPIKKPSLKPEGKKYKVTHDYPFKGILIPKDHILRECDDNWFQVFDPEGFKYFVRMSAENVNNIIGKTEIK